MISRRTLMAGGLALPALPFSSFAEELKGRMKLTMPAGRADDAQLRFISHLGVEWVTTGGPSALTRRKAALSKARTTRPPSRPGRKKTSPG